ncbi:Zn finger homeodomain 1 [Arctopsyche grandis]|uniref:Zn finger homeodomain 1 n=1 Tax=Arctopsyche grandis TaxID=121162 RepID=UPI00406D75EF
MVARGDAMFGCYGDSSYSYRLWSLANWTGAHFPPLSSSDDKSIAEDEEVPIGSVSSRARRSPSLPLGPGGPFTCPQCGGAYPSRELLDKHELLHSPNTQVRSTISCKICNKSFANVYRLQRHMISHDESALLRKFKCNDCDKAFKFKHHLKEHLRIHSGEKPFECGNCGKKFSHSGSYSSHMTSKKCLVMNLKMGRIRPNNPALNPERSPSRKRTPSILPQINNNSSANNNNSFLPMLPNEAAAAYLAAIAPRDGGFPTSPSPLTASALHSLYLSPTMPLHHPGAMTSFLPASISHFIERLTAHPYLPRKLETGFTKDSVSPRSDPEDLIEEVTEEEDKRSSVGDERELVMDIEEEESIKIKQEKLNDGYPHMNVEAPYPSKVSPGITANGNRGLNMILESVLSHQTPNSEKLSQAQSSHQSYDICSNNNAPAEISIKPDPDETLKCLQCHKTFNHKTELAQHEQVLCGKLFRKHEGLAAQVAETLALNRMEAEFHASIHSGMSGSEDDDYSKEIDSKLPHENERKVRVRTAISDEQQSILKEHYARNQRPNREEFKKIAQRLGLDNRVVQVWFQNNRARVRRMNQSISYSEQPLDLSTKKVTQSTTSSPPMSPPCNASMAQSDSGEEAVNLSQKSSRSPTPYRNPFQSHYQHSNCSSSSLTDFRHSPSPNDAILNGSRKLLQPLKTHPNQIIAMPLDKMPIYDPEDAPHSPALNSLDAGRASSSSPSSERRSWTEESRISQQDTDGDESLSKKNRLKNLVDKEPEGQFICDQCDKAFVKQSSLARHKYEHSGQRPYKCIECPKAFKHKHHLTEHKRLHTGEKPFQCCKCLKKFSHSGSYSQHMNHRYSYCKPYRE